jgi:hypothetical protein
MRRNYMLNNTDIILSLLRSGYAHNCPRCERGMHVAHGSGLCVWCYNEQRNAERTPQITCSVSKRRPRRPASKPALEAAS